MAQNAEEEKTLEKLQILAYASAEEVGSPDTELDIFEAMFDVESYSRTYENVYQGGLTAGINTSSRPARYSYSRAGRLNFQLILDNTGIHHVAVEAAPDEEPGVSEQIDNFLAVCYDYDGELHEPRYLLVKWGSLAFKCRLLSADIKYTLFDRSGDPLRAEVDAVFMEDISEEERIKKEDKKSPDVARIHTLVDGDSLPLLAKKYYGSAQHHLYLAWANEINHIREIEVGRDIQVPALDELVEKFGS